MRGTFTSSLYDPGMSSDLALNLIILSALVVPLPVLGAVCWWFWKARNDE